MPEDFEMCFKVWEKLTIPVYAKQPRYGVKAGQTNARFLDAQVFKDFVLAPYREAKFGPHTGPFIFEFQRHCMSTEEFCSPLDGFFGELPKDFRYAVSQLSWWPTGSACETAKSSISPGTAWTVNGA